MVATFELDDKEFVVKNGCNGLYTAILIPIKDRNQEIIEISMKKLHFFRCQPIDSEVLIDRKNRKWEVARFEL